MKRALWFIAMAGAAGAALAGEPKMPAEMPGQVLCTRQDSTGFVWERGAWRRAQMAAELGLAPTFTIKRLDVGPRAPGEALGTYPMCEEAYVRSTFDDITVWKACFIATETGQPERAWDAAMCFVDFEGDRLKAVSCGGLQFLPGGEFLQASTTADVSRHPKDGRKRPLVLSVGRCSKG